MNAVTATPPTTTVGQPRADERLKRVSPLTALIRRPELGAIGGLVLVTLFFVSMANPTMFSLAGVMNFMAPAAQLGILAIGAALLMIGGEFDLSLGSMVAFAGLVFAACLVVWHLPLSVALVTTFAVAVLIAGCLKLHIDTLRNNPPGGLAWCRARMLLFAWAATALGMVDQFAALGLRLRHRLEEQGWVVLGWGDIGPVHLFSKIPVRNIEDLRHLKLWQWADDPISKRLYSALNIQGVPLHLPEVLPGLSTGAVDAFFGSPLSTVALQWGTYARYMSAAPITMGTGATVIAQAVWDRLDPNDRKVILDESARLEAEVMARVREDNVRALAKMREGGLQIIEVTPAFEAELEKVAQRVSEEIARDVALEYGQRVRGIVEAVRARRPGN